MTGNTKIPIIKRERDLSPSDPFITCSLGYGLDRADANAGITVNAGSGVAISLIVNH